MALTVPSLSKAAPGRHSDGNGLYLYVKKDGRKTWVFRYRDRRTGKLRDKGLGQLKDVKLADARELARDCRSQLLKGIDPIDARIAARLDAKLQQARRATFGQCVDAFIEANKAGWTNQKHVEQWRSTLKTHCKSITDLPVSSIDVALVHSVLKPIWTTKTETATRLRARIERVLDWATTSGLRTGDNPARWKNKLKHVLPSTAKLRQVKHRPALEYAAVPKFMTALRLRKETSAAALQLQILTATRPGEAVGMRWDELDAGKGLWTIPASRTKSRKVHVVPLSKEALALLSGIVKRDTQHVFPGKRNRSITTAATLKTLRLLEGTEGLSNHGFRSSFRDWAAEATNHSRDVAEMALAHEIKGKTEASYYRTTLLMKRARLMQDWATYCYNDTPPDDASGVP